MMTVASILLAVANYCNDKNSIILLKGLQFEFGGCIQVHYFGYCTWTLSLHVFCWFPSLIYYPNGHLGLPQVLTML